MHFESSFPYYTNKKRLELLAARCIMQGATADYTTCCCFNYKLLCSTITILAI